LGWRADIIIELGTLAKLIRTYGCAAVQYYLETNQMQILMVVNARNSNRTRFSMLSEKNSSQRCRTSSKDETVADREAKPIISIGFRLHPELNSSIAVTSPRLLIFFSDHIGTICARACCAGTKTRQKHSFHHQNFHLCCVLRMTSPLETKPARIPKLSSSVHDINAEKPPFGSR
jgi:hypothetical protein